MTRATIQVMRTIPPSTPHTISNTYAGTKQYTRTVEIYCDVVLNMKHIWQIGRAQARQSGSKMSRNAEKSKWLRDSQTGKHLPHRSERVTAGDSPPLYKLRDCRRDVNPGPFIHSFIQSVIRILDDGLGTERTVHKSYLSLLWGGMHLSPW